MNFPVMDNRNKQDILDRLIELARFYIPEWDENNGRSDMGMVMFNIFADMFLETVTQFNKMPDKLLIYYLNLMGAQILPPVPSEGYLIVKNGGIGEALIKKGTRAYGTDTDGEKVIFRLKDDLYSIDNTITEIFCTCGKSVIVKAFDNQTDLIVNDSGEVALFDFYNYENLQQHRLIIASGNILNTKCGATVLITVINHERPFLEEKTTEIISDNELVNWKVHYEGGWENAVVIKAGANKIIVKTNKPIPVTEVDGKTGRWLCCEVNTNREIFFTDLFLSVKGNNLQADCLYNNDLHLNSNNFLPFGETFTKYDCFYIGCAEAFSKNGAAITVEFTVCFSPITQSEKPVDMKKWKPIFSSSELYADREVNVYINEVVWEYWNGYGWMRLPVAAHSGSFRRDVKETVTFICPEDIEQCLVGGSENYFIRAKILKHGDITFNCIIKYPIIREISISYKYEGRGIKADKMLLQNNLEINAIHNCTDEIGIKADETSELATAFFAFEKPISGKMFSIYFQNAVNIDNPPEIKFEYYGIKNGKTGWLPFKIFDETNCFSVSGIITFICDGRFEKLRLFNMERYWIRAVNTDNKYCNKHIQKPHFKGMYFNAAKICQLEEKEPEYFLIEYGEVNKICKLSSEGALNVSVYVNEANENPAVFEDGVENWVKWQCVDNLNSSKPLDRVYILDSNEGTITFGNGKKGKIPTSGQYGTIRVEYSVCKGERGNISENGIEGFADSVPFIDKVFNPEPVFGGCEKEQVNAAIDRNVQLLGRNLRIISEDDCEAFAVTADRNIVKVKALISNNGDVVIAVLPKFLNSGKSRFQPLKDRIMKKFELSPAILLQSHKIQVTEVVYIQFSVHATVLINNLHDFHTVHATIENKLTGFFHPITGNYGKGFDIGALPTKVQIINYLNDIGIVIDSLYITCSEKSCLNSKEIDYEKALTHQYAVPLSGTHEIEITLR